jgi:hypothetical protein
MRRTGLTTMSVALLAAITISGAALSQGGPGPGPGRGPGERGWGPGMMGWDGEMTGPGMMGWGMRRGFWGRGPEGMLDRVEGRLAFVKAEFKITEAQTPAWNELAAAIRSAAKQHNERMRSAFKDASERTLPERLDLQEQLMTARIEEIKQVRGSLKTLYAQLSEEQKREADHVVLPMVGMGGPMW